MRFTVVWKPQAERTLLELWLESSQRDALTSAAEEIESLVRQRPESVGESRGHGRDGFSWTLWAWTTRFRSMTES